MRPEKLQSLLYSFIENKLECDEIDGPGDLTAFDDPLRQRHFNDQFVCRGGHTPVSPLQFFPFVPPAAHSPAVVEAARNLVQTAAQFSSSRPDRSVIQFEDTCMVKEPREQVISVPIIRSQSCIDKVTTVTWNTHDKTARSGIHYVGSSGEIVFERNETRKIIKIQILNSPDERNKDFRFTVELSHVGGLFNPRPMTVSLEKIDMFYPNERQVLNDLPRSPPFSVDEVRYILDTHLNSRTFHVALTHLCSISDAIDVQFALACDLSMRCLRNLSGEYILDILTDYFRMDDIDY